MPNRMLTPETKAYLLGSFASIDDLNSFIPLEESMPEPSLMLMELDFTEPPSSETLAGLNQALLEAGVDPWPGYGQIVFADPASEQVTLAWTKGTAWMPIIIGILALTVFPILLGGLIWLIIPEPVKQMINMVVMLLVMMLMMRMLAPMLAPAKEKPKEVEGGRR
ncbi:hypothetical protein M1O54_00085 [Dehalococcoidia bacterium]|nr:hypothetical protein [Dehalococcoidia bacterium]